MHSSIYKKKVLTLSALAGVLALVYGGTILFSPERRASRKADYSWLDEKVLPLVDRIEITGASGEIDLDKQGGLWVILKEGNDYPVKQGRVEDFLKILSLRRSYPLRATSESSHEALGVDEAAASRIILRGGPGLPGTVKPPLLDLLIGHADATGQELYLRRAGDKDVRSGDRNIETYLNGSVTSWYNLLLFGDQRLPVSGVQRVTVIPLREEAAGEAPEEEPEGSYTLSRQGQGWVIQGNEAVLDTQKVESYLRAILEAEGENFNPALSAADPVFNEGRIILELGDRSSRTIRVGKRQEGGKRDAAVSGSPFVYTLAEWTVNRIFRDAGEFQKESGE